MMSEAQKSTTTNKLRKGLDEVCKTFEAALPTMAGIDADHLNELSSIDSRSITLAMSDFSLRWQPLKTQILVSNNLSSRVRELQAARAALEVQLAAESEALLASATSIVDSSKGNSELGRAIKEQVERVNAAGALISIYQGYREWAEHLKALGYGNGCVWTYLDHLRGEHVPGKTRQALLDEQHAVMSDATAALESRIALCDTMLEEYLKKGKQQQTTIASLVELRRKIQEVTEQIETLYRLGAR